MPVIHVTKPFSKQEAMMGTFIPATTTTTNTITTTLPLGWTVTYDELLVTTPVTKEDVKKIVLELLEQEKLKSLAKQKDNFPVATTVTKTESQVINKNKEECIEVAYRLAAKQLLKIGREFLSQQFAKGNETVASLFLSSEWGTAITASFILTLVADKFPQKHLDILSKELRVSTLALVANDTVDLFKETLSKLNLPQETCKTVPVVLEQTHEEELVYESRRIPNQQ